MDQTISTLLAEYRLLHEDIANTIWKQLTVHTKMAIGAREPSAGPASLKLKVGGKPMRYIEIELDRGHDLYNVHFFRLKRNDYSLVTLAKMKGVGVGELNSVVYDMVHGKIKGKH